MADHEMLNLEEMGNLKDSMELLGEELMNGSSAACTIATTSASKEKHASPTLKCLDSAYSPGESIVSSFEFVYWVL